MFVSSSGGGGSRGNEEATAALYVCVEDSLGLYVLPFRARHRFHIIIHPFDVLLETWYHFRTVLGSFEGNVRSRPPLSAIGSSHFDFSIFSLIRR
jgi:hypothetical protein